jgi:hypothetical protein
LVSLSIILRNAILYPATTINFMKPSGFISLIALLASIGVITSALAETTIASFDNFNLDGLFGNWGTATIVSGETNYSITSSGYGSGFKAINPNIDATGETNIELTVTLNAPAGVIGPVSGPIVSLVDADGTLHNYAWYGQTKGTRVLTLNLNAPTFVSNAGTTPGLDLSRLAFFHLQDDPGAYSGQYTITFEHLRLTGAPRPNITVHSFNPDTQQFTLTWSSLPGKTYTIMHTPDLNAPFSPLMTDIPSGGTSTSATVTVPAGTTGFLRIQQQ